MREILQSTLKFIWSDFDQNSEYTKLMSETKAKNDINFWPNMRKVINHDCDVLPLSRFRMWASMHAIPLITTSTVAMHLGRAFNLAVKDQNVADALIENWVGIPEAYRYIFKVADDFDTSMQRCQDLSHLVTGDFINLLPKYRSILEIGGGYGNMCSLVHDLGFKGQYSIFDFPEVHRIQKYYLERNDINANFITEVEDLNKVDLVIATWSLSEIPLEQRNEIMKRIKQSYNWLVLYQENAFNGGIDNSKYFQETFHDRITHTELAKEGEYDGKNFYMIVQPKHGWKK